MRLRLLLLLLGLPLTAAADAQKPFVGPVAATGLKNGATLTYDGNTQVGLAADGRMALGNGKTVWIQNVAIADTTRVYWAPTQMGLSLDNRDVSVGEKVTFDSGHSDLSRGIAVFSGGGFLSTQNDAHQAVDIRLYMEVKDDATNNPIVLVEVPELPTGVAVPLQNNRRHRIRLIYQVRVDNNWESAYDHFNSINNSADVGSAYTFAHGFFYDAAPKAITLSKTNVDENTPAGVIATISVTDANPVTASASFTLVPGTGPTNNANFNIPPATANLRSNRAFDFESEPTQRIVIEAKNDYGTIDVPFTLTINDVNEAPTALHLSPNSVNENAATGTTVGTLSTTDPDTAAAFRAATFAFATPPADGTKYSNNLFTIDGTTLKTGQVFDFENPAFPNGDYKIYVTATDGPSIPSAQRKSFTGAIAVKINNQNDAPQAQGVSITVLEDTAFTLPWTSFSSRITDQDNGVAFPNTLSQFILRSSPTKGTLRYNNANAPHQGYTQAMLANVVYQGNANFNGTDTFSWAAYDGQATGPEATVTITVTPVNDPPSFDALPNLTINEDDFNTTSRTITLTNLSPGPDESEQRLTLTGTVVSTSGGGTANGLITNLSGSASVPTGTIQFRTVPDGYGTAVVRVTARDDGGTANNGIDTFSREFSVTINPVDDPPVKIQDLPALTLNENDPARTIDLSNYFRDVDSPLTYVVTQNTKDAGSGNAIPTLVSATISGATLTLVPTNYSYGTGSITIEARGADAQNPAIVKTVSSTFTLKVENVDHPPQVGAGAPASLTFNEDAGTVTVALDNWFYDPDLDSFSDVRVELASIDQTYLDLGNTTATRSGTVDGAFRGTLTLALKPNVFTAYTAANGSTGNGTTSLTVTAVANSRSTSYTVPITINEINDPPTLAIIGDQLIDQGTQPHYVALTGIGPGPGESAIDQVTSVTASGGAAGIIDPASVAINALNLAAGTAQLTYTLQPFKFGADSITVTLADARGGVTTQTFTVKANHVNQAPRVVSPLPAPFLNAPQQNGAPVLTFLEDQVGATIDASTLFWDPDGDTTRQSIFANTVPSLVALTTPSASSGRWDLAPQPDQNGTTNLILRATDGFLTGDFPFVIVITPVNDAPTLDPIANQRINQGAAPRTLSLTGLGTGPGNEADQTLLAITPTVVASSTPGLITSVTAALPTGSGSASTGSLTFAVAETLSGTATIRVTLQDNGGTANGGVDTAWREFTVTVNPVDDAPTRQRSAGEIVFLEDQFAGTNNQTTIDLTGNFADRARDPITLRITKIVDAADILDNETPGRVVVPPSAPESILVTFKSDASGSAVITYGATAKGLNSTDTDNLTLTITPVNDAPRMRAPSTLVATQGRVGPYPLPLRDISPGPADEAAQTVTVVGVEILAQSVDGLIATAEIVDGTPPSLSFTISPTLAGTATLRVTLRDNGGTAHGGVDTATFDFPVTVLPVDSPPTRTGSLPPQRFFEDQFANNRYETTINLAGVFTDPDGDAVSLVLTAEGISDPEDILDDEDRLVVVDGTNPQRINLTFRPNRSGRASITVSAVAGTLSSAPFSFDVVVDPVNDAPTLAPLANLALTTDSGPQTIALTGISPGPVEEAAQRVTSVSAAVVASSTPGLIDPATIAVNYTPGATTGTLTFVPAAGLTGTATLAVAAQDDGGTELNGVDTITRQFLVTVAFADRPPVLTAPKGTVTFSEDDFPGNGTNVRQINLTGVFTDPDGDAISIVINSITDPDNILSDRDVAVDAANPQILNVPIFANAFGHAVIRYRAVAARKLSADYDELTIEITPSNDAPRLNPIDDQTVDEDSAPSVILLTGITPGANEDASLLTVTASIVQQSPANLIQNLTVDYTAPSTTGSLSYTLGQDLAGQAIVRVTVNDGHGLTFSRQFDIFVRGADDAPTVNVLADTYTLLEDQRDANSSTTAVPYANVFTDHEGDPLTLLVQSVTDGPANIVDDERGGVFVMDSAPMALQLRLNPDANGSFTVETRAHAGSRVSAGSNQRTFNVLPVNDAPTAVLPANGNFPEGSAPLVFQITGISPGPANESAQLVTSVTASADATGTTAGLVTDVTTDYTPGATTATVTVTLAPRVAGSAQINVALRDDGGTANGGEDTASGSFLLTITPVADPPELVAGREETFVAYSTDALPTDRRVEIDLSGVFTDHDGDPIQLVFKSISDPEHILEEDAPGGLAFSATNRQVLQLLFSPDSYGEAVIEFQALAGGAFSTESATLRILLTPPLGAPSFDPVANRSISEGVAQFSINVTGIRGGLPPPDPAIVQTLSAQILNAFPANLFTAVAPADIDYTAGAAHGTIRVHPAAKLAGTATLRLTVTDNGTASATRATSFSQDITLTVTPQDDPPRLVGTFVAPLINEDQFLAAGGVTRFDFSNLFTDDDGDPISVRLVNLQDPDNVLDNENGHMTTDPLNPQKLILAFHENAFGPVEFNVVGVANGVPSLESITVRFDVNPVNDAPTLDALPALAITEQHPSYSVPLTGLTVGPANESSQTIDSVTPTIVSSTVPNLLTNLTVTPGADDSTRTLSFGVGARFGTAIVQVAVKDSGGTAFNGQDTFTRQFAVNVNIVDQPPALVRPVAPLEVLEDHFAGTGGVTTLSLADNYADPDGHEVTYVLGAIADLDDILADEQPGAIALSGPQNATLKLTLRPNAFGSATIRYRANSRGLFATTFDTLQITVTPVNDAPSFDTIANLSVPAGSAEKVITIAGLSVGPRESAVQTLQSLVANVTAGGAQFAVAPSVTINPPGRTATLRFTPSNVAGTATVQVVAQDSGDTAHGGVNTFARSFTITVTPVDHPPAAAGPPPAYNYTEDQFAGANHLTTETLPVLFTDPDGDAVTLLLGAISDPHDVLDNESGRVRLLPGNVLQLAFVPDASGAATIPIHGFANGRQSLAPQNIVITVAAVNDAPIATLPQSVAVAPDQRRVSFMLELQSPGPREEEQRLMALEAAWIAPTAEPVPVPSLSFTRSGAVPLEVELPGGLDFTSGTLRLTVRDSGGVAGGGVDTLTQDVAFAREVDERPWRVGTGGLPTVQRATLNGVVGLRLDFTGRYTARGNGAVTLVPLGLDDPAGAIDLSRSGLVAGEPAQLFLALRAAAPSATVSLAYSAAHNGILAAATEVFSFTTAGAALTNGLGAGGSTLHARPIVRPVDRAEVFASTALPEAQFGEVYRWQWLGAGNDAGFGATENAVAGGPFAAAALQVPVTDGTHVRWETVSRGAFVRRLADRALARGAAALADDDHDGLPALLEHLLGLDPERSERGVLSPTVVRERGRSWLEFRYSRMKSRVEGVLQLERLDEQGRWVPVTTPPEILAAHEETDLVRVLFPLEGTHPVLLRLRAATVE